MIIFDQLSGTMFSFFFFVVSSEIQVSFSKQLQQLEEERDLLRQQLRQSQTQVKENSSSKTRINVGIKLKCDFRQNQRF